ncbi:MAG TPA: radical SAM protein [Methylomirabilota bacterium]|jgi:radical SAM protein with 4Fe4S-binding SPASM domain|nr:radical SAM protein [Methylomirabilota bacterium]
MAFSVGIGLTNECNLRCPHCYRPDMVIDRLTLEDVERVCASIPIRSMNLGVGENGLHPDYRAILETLWERGIKTSMTSNSLSLDVLPDDAVKRFHSVEFSLDFPSEREHDAFRGAGNWRAVHSGIERCATLGVPATVTAVMMRTNYNRLADLARVAAACGANLRVNIYQPAKTDRFTLSYEEFWEGFRRLLGAARLVATTEPVLAAVLGWPGFAGPGCGRSTVRVAPDGRVLPCTYWPTSQLTLADLERLGEGIAGSAEFVAAREMPAACIGCPCRGGCAGRRAVLGKLHEADPYCPFARRDRVVIDWEPAAVADLPKLGSACTTVVSTL